MKKYVITGGPGTGKTSVIGALKALGYISVPESARQIIEEQERCDGDALPWINVARFQQLVANRQIESERKVREQTAFLDRGLVDVHGYCLHYNISTPEGLRELVVERYHRVFILDRLPRYLNDKERREDKHTATEIHRNLQVAYADLGYAPIVVPVLSIEERVRFILERI